MQVRERRLYILAGAPRSGKSTWMSKYIKRYNGNVIILKHKANINDDTFLFLPEKTTSNWRQGAQPGAPVKCKMSCIRTKKKKEYLTFLNWIVCNYRNGLLVIDDASIFERNTISDEMNDLAAMRAHYGIDVMLAFHSLTKTPIDSFGYVNYFLIFNTTDNFEYKKDKLPTNIDQLRDAHVKARQIYAAYPQGDPRKYEPVIVKNYS